MSKKLRPHFSIAFQGDVWQQSLSDGLLLITTRDQEQMQVSFSLVRLTDGSMVFEDLSFEENWWISVYHFFGDTVVFQIYEDTQDIEAKSYFALNVIDQEALWSLDKVMAVGRQEHYLQLRSVEAGDAFFWIDIRTGETYGEIPSNNDKTTIRESVLHPLHYTEEGAYFGTVRDFVDSRLKVKAKGACDYLEYDDLVFVAYHVQESEEMKNHLAVFDKAGELEFHQLLHEGLQGMVSEAFFIAAEQLIFVEGRNTLKSYLIKN